MCFDDQWQCVAYSQWCSQQNKKAHQTVTGEARNASVISLIAIGKISFSLLSKRTVPASSLRDNVYVHHVAGFDNIFWNYATYQVLYDV